MSGASSASSARRALAAGCPNCGTPNPPAAKFCGECATPPVHGAGDPQPGDQRSTGSSRPAARSPSAGWCRSCSPTWSASPRSPRSVTPRRSARPCRATSSSPRTSSAATAAPSRSSSATRSWPCGGRPRPTRTTRSGPCAPALELVDAVRSLGPAIQARAGVLTGEAAVTIGATNQGMVAGDLVNTASRLQSAAAAREPCSSARRPSGRHRGRSRSRRPASRRSRARRRRSRPGARCASSPSVGGRNRSETLEAPFVGRDDELRLLKDLFHATGREGRARLVSVIGPAGIGKTPPRLGVPEVPRRARRDGLVARRAAARPMATGSASGRSARWSAGGPACSRRTTTRRPARGSPRSLAEHVPDPDDRRWIEPALLALLGIETGVGSEQLFGAWRTFFERLADDGPGGPRLRGLPLRRLGPDQLRRPPASSGAGTRRSTSSR